jgi:hypothetical protein
LTNGILQSDSGGNLAKTPGQPYAANTIQRSGEITLDPEGAVDGNIRFLMTGQEALYWRQHALEYDIVEVKKKFDEWLAQLVPDGIEAHIDHFTGLDDPDSDLSAAITVKGTLGAATSKRLLLPALFFSGRGSHPFVQEDKRITPIDMHYPEQITDSVTYLLPAGFQFEDLPKPTKVSWPGRGELNIDFKSDPGKITVVRQFTRAFTLFKEDEYPALHDFYQKVAAADQQQLALTRTPAAKAK